MSERKRGRPKSVSFHDESMVNNGMKSLDCPFETVGVKQRSLSVCSDEKRKEVDGYNLVSLLAGSPLLDNYGCTIDFFRTEHHRVEFCSAQFANEERILLFESNRPGSIGKIVFSCDSILHDEERSTNEQENFRSGTNKRNDPSNVAAVIHVLSVKETHRGLDLGGFLVTQALACIRERFHQKISISFSLIAKEDISRHGRLVKFYEDFGFRRTNTTKTRSLGNKNDGEIHCKVPMQLVLCCTGGTPISQPQSSIRPEMFVPVSLFARRRLRGIDQALTLNGDVSHWLIVVRDHGKMLVQPTRHCLVHCQQGGLCCFLMQRACVGSSDCSDSPCQFFQLQSTSNGLLLGADTNFDVILNNGPSLWEFDKKKFSLTKTHGHPAWRHIYRRSWSIQCVSYVTRMRQRHIQFNTYRMSVSDALDLAKMYPSSPYSPCPSIRTLMFATAELARREGQPDWVQFVALIFGLACVLKGKDNSCTALECDSEFDWTIPGLESRILGCMPCQSSTYSEFLHLNPDKNDRQYNNYLGIYERKQGLENVLLSWSTCEYMYYFLKRNEAFLPNEAYILLKLNPLVDWHTRGKYQELAKDEEEDEKHFVSTFYDICERARISVVQAGHETTDEESLSLWHKHYALIVRKFIGSNEILCW